MSNKKTTKQTAQVPQAPETELLILGTILLYPKAMDVATRCTLESYDFVTPANKQIYETCKNLNEKRTPISLASVSDALQMEDKLDEVGGRKFLAEVMKAAVIPEVIPDYVKTLKECTMRRLIIKCAADSAENGGTEEISDAITNYSQSLEKIQKFYNAGLYGESNLDAMTDYIAGEELLNELDIFSNIRLKTNFPYLDNMLGGYLYPGMYTLAALTSLGKTTLLSQISDQVAEQQYPVLYISIEQTRLDILMKSLSRRVAKMYPSIWKESSGSYCVWLTANNLKRYWKPGMKETDPSPLSPRQIAAINEAFEWYKTTIAPYMNIMGANFQCELDDIVNKIKNFIAKTGTKPFVVLDYLQIIQQPLNYTGSDQHYIDKCVTTLERLAKAEMITIFTISSVNRGSYLTPISPESFKGSSSIEFSSDALLAMDLVAIEEGVKESDDKVDTRKLIEEERNASPRRIVLRTLKNRNGKGGKSYFLYYPEQELFKNVETKPEAPTIDYGLTTQQSSQTTTDNKQESSNSTAEVPKPVESSSVEQTTSEPIDLEWALRDVSKEEQEKMAEDLPF